MAGRYWVSHRAMQAHMMVLCENRHRTAKQHGTTDVSAARGEHKTLRNMIDCSGAGSCCAHAGGRGELHHACRRAGGPTALAHDGLARLRHAAQAERLLNAQPGQFEAFEWPGLVVVVRLHLHGMALHGMGCHVHVHNMDGLFGMACQMMRGCTLAYAQDGSAVESCAGRHDVPMLNVPRSNNARLDGSNTPHAAAAHASPLAYAPCNVWSGARPSRCAGP